MRTVPIPFAGTSSAASSRPGSLCVKFRAGFRWEEFEEEAAAVSAKPSLAPTVTAQPQVTVFSDKSADLCCLTRAYSRYKGTDSGPTARSGPPCRLGGRKAGRSAMRCMWKIH